MCNIDNTRDMLYRYYTICVIFCQPFLRSSVYLVACIRSRPITDFKKLRVYGWPSIILSFHTKPGWVKLMRVGWKSTEWRVTPPLDLFLQRYLNNNMLLCSCPVTVLLNKLPCLNGTKWVKKVPEQFSRNCAVPRAKFTLSCAIQRACCPRPDQHNTNLLNLGYNC